MPVPTTAADLSTTAASNSPADGASIGTSHAEYLRAYQAIIKQENSAGANIASATAITVPSAGKYFIVTGNVQIDSIVDSWTGRTVFLKLSGTPIVAHSAGLILPGAASITGAAGDVLVMCNESTGVWRCLNWLKSAIVPGAASSFSGILPSANGGTANGFTKFDGPTTSEKTFTLPDASATLVTLSTAQTFITAAKTFTNSLLKLLGSSTGAHTFTSSNAGATNYTVTVGAQDVILADITATTGGLVPTPPNDATQVLLGSGVFGAAPAPTSAGGASLVLLSTVTAANSATVDIETTFDATYDNYLLVASGITVQTDAQPIECRMKIGGSYVTSGYMFHASETSSASSSYSANVDAAGTFVYILGAGIGNAAAESGNFNMTIKTPSSTAFAKQITWDGSCLTAAGVEVHCFGSAHNTGTAALTGVRFYAASGNIVAGNFRLYGIKNS